jgi:Rieske Fe-S protein
MEITRREFTAAAAGTAVAIGLAGCGDNHSPTPEGAGKPAGGTAQAATKPAPGEILAAKLVNNPFLIGAPSAYAAPKLYDAFSQSGIWLVSDGKTLVALSAACTHKGCPVRWRPMENGFYCKCHGSRYDAQGIVLPGQKAQRPLERCALRLVEGQIEVDPNRRFKKDAQVNQFGDPAASLAVG